MSGATYVMPEPQVRVVDGEFRFTGEAIPVNVEGNVLDYLHAAGVYDSQPDVYGRSVYFDDNFSVKDRLGEVDEILGIIDGKRLEKDLEEKGYAFLMAKGDPGKFKDYQDKGFIANIDRVIQELVYQKIPKEFKLGFSVRHLKVQESVELMNSDKKYKETMDNYWNHILEIIQKLAKQKAFFYRLKDDKLDMVEVETETLGPFEIASIGCCWHTGVGRSVVDAGRPLYRAEHVVAALKRKEM